MKRLLFLGLIIMLALASCRTYNSKADYFNGSVLVEYNQTTSRNEDDTVTFTFYDKGDYSVKFSYTDGKTRGVGIFGGPAKLPADFTFSIQDSPRTKVVSQYMLPGFLTISITHNGVTETHSFQ